MIRAARVESVVLPEAGAPSGTRRYPERRALLLRLEDDRGAFGLGEAAPLPGYMPGDDLERARDALASLPRELELDPSAPLLSELRRASAPLASSSARFAVESALVELVARRQGETASAILRRALAELEGSPRTAFATGAAPAYAALLPSEPDSALDAAKLALARGIRTFKLKLGEPGAFSRELAALETLRKNLGPVGLRADANRAFSEPELRARLAELAALALEWLEEPTSEPLHGPLGLPLALDESLQTEDPDPAAARALGVTAFILKPTALGGLTRALELAARARAAELKAVVSHVYEGPTGMSALHALAAALGPDRPADGLDRDPRPGAAERPGARS